MKNKSEQKEQKEQKDMKKTHYSIPTWKIKTLKEIGETYNVKFNNPPFDNSDEEGYFDIDAIRKTKKWKNFIKEIMDLKVHYEFAFKVGEGKKIYMPVQIWEKRS